MQNTSHAKMSLSGGSGQSANMIRAFAKGGPMNTIRKFILAVVATAVATSLLPTSSFAKKSQKPKNSRAAWVRSA